MKRTNRGRPTFLKNSDQVAQKIAIDFANHNILSMKGLIAKLLQYDRELEPNQLPLSATTDTLSEKTVNKFLRKYGLPSVRESIQHYKTLYSKDKFVKNFADHTELDEKEDECLTLSTAASSGLPLIKNQQITTPESLPQFTEKYEFEFEGILESVSTNENVDKTNSNNTMQILMNKINQDELRLREKDEKIARLARLLTGLACKFTPSRLILTSEDEMKGKRIAYSCFRALIQVLNGLEPILKWIINNDLLLPQDQKKNSWFWRQC
jgi:hypothetical protein